MRRARLTEREAGERSALVSRTRYDVTVDLRDPEAPRSSTRIRFDARAAGTTFVEAGDQRIRLQVVPGAQSSQHAQSPRYHSGGGGLCRVVDEADGSTYVYAASGPGGASRWFTCFDQPDLKAATTLRVAAPSDWVVTGTGMGEEAGAVVPTYATGFVAGPLASETEQGVVLYAMRSRAAALREAAPDLARIATEVVAAIEARIGRLPPGAGGRLRVAFVPHLAWPAIETAGCVLVRDSLLVAPGTAGYAQLVCVLAHEIAHRWFGLLVTLRWWDDLWLQEALADVVSESALRASPTGSSYAGAIARRRVHHPVMAARQEAVADPLASTTSQHYSAGRWRVQGWRRSLGEEEWWDRLARVVSAARPLDPEILRPRQPPAAGADRWDELQVAVGACEIDASSALDVLLSLLAQERDADRLASMATWFTEVLHRVGWAQPAEAREAEQLVADALRGVVANAPDGSRTAATATYAWVSMAAAPPVRRLLDGLDGSLSAGPLAWAARHRLAALGALGRAGIVAAGGECGVDAVTCLAYLPDAAEKEAAWRRLFDPGPPDPVSLAAMAAGLWHRDHSAHVGGLSARYRREIEGLTDAYDEARAAMLARFAFPRSVLTADALGDAEGLLSAAGLRPAVRATVTECAAELAWSLRFRAGGT